MIVFYTPCLTNLQAGIFSATVAAFLIESYKILMPDPLEVSSMLFQQVVQELVEISNGDHLTPPALDSFEPRSYAIHVNILWFLSLSISLSCGLGATLVQQWVRRYLQLTRHADTPIHRVRIRTFLFSGIQEFQVRMFVEIVSLLLHVAIFLFCAGLIEFFLAINDEVAQIVRAVICIFVAIYIILTSLPIIFQQCPFRTPLTSVFWCITRTIIIGFLSPFTCSDRVRTKVRELWRQLKHGFDCRIMSAVEEKPILDKEAVRLTLRMCRDANEVEAFLDAVPGYLQMGDDVTSRFNDIGSLLKHNGVVLPLGQRMVQLFSSCINDEGRMDDAARRHRALVCSHAVLELSMAVLSVTGRGLTLDLPKAIGHKLQHLSRDHDPKIAFAAARTVAIVERALFDQLSDAEERKDLARVAVTAELLAETFGKNDPASLRYQTGVHDNIWKDGRLIAVTEFISSIIALHKRSWHPTRQDVEDIKWTIEELCRGLNGREFLPSTQERFVDDMASVPTGTL